MALSQGNQILWNDIKAVMNNIKAARTKMKYATTTIDGLINGTNPGQATAATMTTLYNQINECTNRPVAANNTTVKNNKPNASPPAVGNLIQLTQINAINNMANAIKALNFSFSSFSSHDSSFCSDSFSFGFNYFS